MEIIPEEVQNALVISRTGKKNKTIKIYYTKCQAENINEFKNKNVISFAGIGNPINFFDLLSKYKINILEKISFPDHYNYSVKDLENLIKKSKIEEIL